MARRSSNDFRRSLSPKRNQTRRSGDSHKTAEKSCSALDEFAKFCAYRCPIESRLAFRFGALEDQDP